ncbi:hypothetical protein [Tepidiforma sp.]|uniref:hypothetical protein n=1 Tax=Tepidiforma sp. TaxID=2682230 RepID=UPI0021DE878A|nr:hypothetical protein [Tepidiforma sp.]MCX7616913.1 hypothetical protein [Tepidiforma sp.]GIW17358.1 MAG: hypothetical protein KatS3mg064_0515 [Tepidiforma sp.]
MDSLTRCFADRSIMTIAVSGLAALAMAFAAGTLSTADGRATDAAVIPAGERHWVLEGAPAEQQGALADLEVAREEYVAAIEAERKCLTDQGIWVSDTWWEDNQLRYTFGGVPSREQAASVFEVYRACHATYARNVATGWAIGSAPAQP